MSYTFEKVADKNYVVRFEHNGKQIEFNGIVAKDETELDSLVQAQIAYLDRGEGNWTPNYAEKRRREYPPIEEYIDGVVKGDQAQVHSYIDKCLAVKAKYPKE
jgi:hypothetical protein